MNRRIEMIPSHVEAALLGYSWPGNVRELENFIERAVILSRGPALEIPAGELKSEMAVEASDETRLEAIEREHIRRVLREANWQVGGPTGAAARLGLARSTLQSRMRKLGISRPK
jgi:formate hydrogenlyase transcriptional activator